MEQWIIDKINKLISDDKVSRLQYFHEIDDLIWNNIEYYGMNVEVVEVTKYIKHKDFFEWMDVDDNMIDNFNEAGVPLPNWISTTKKIFPHMKAIYIVKLLDQKDINDDNEGYMFMDTSALSHSEELRTES